MFLIKFNLNNFKMIDSERSISSSKDSKNLEDSKLTEESNQMSIQEIIDNQFDELENWVDEQFENVKKDCMNAYHNFKVEFGNKKNKKNNYEENSNDE